MNNICLSLKSTNKLVLLLIYFSYSTLLAAKAFPPDNTIEFDFNRALFPVYNNYVHIREWWPPISELAFVACAWPLTGSALSYRVAHSFCSVGSLPPRFAWRSFTWTLSVTNSIVTLGCCALTITLSAMFQLEVGESAKVIAQGTV